MKTSWRKCLTFNNLAIGFAQNGQTYPGLMNLHPDTKFAYALKRVVDQIAKLNDAMQVKFEDIDLANCATTHAVAGDSLSPQVIVRDAAGNLCYTVEGTKARRDARTALLDAEDIEIEPYFATDIPDLEDAVRDVLRGFVIRETELSMVPDERAVNAE